MRRQQGFGLLLVFGSLIGLGGNALHPHTVESDDVAFLTEIASSSTWVGIHLAIIVAVLLLVGGLVGLHALIEGPIRRSRGWGWSRQSSAVRWFA